MYMSSWLVVATFARNCNSIICLLLEYVLRD